VRGVAGRSGVAGSVGVSSARGLCVSSARGCVFASASCVMSCTQRLGCAAATSMPSASPCQCLPLVPAPASSYRHPHAILLRSLARRSPKPLVRAARSITYPHPCPPRRLPLARHCLEARGSRPITICWVNQPLHLVASGQPPTSPNPNPSRTSHLFSRIDAPHHAERIRRPGDPPPDRRRPGASLVEVVLNSRDVPPPGGWLTWGGNRPSRSHLGKTGTALG